MLIQKLGRFAVAGALVLSMGVMGSYVLEASELSPFARHSGPSDPHQGEVFIYGEILAINGVELEIEQHMEPGSVDVNGYVILAAEVEVMANRGDHKASAQRVDLEVGQMVGMIKGSCGFVRTVIFDDMEEEKGHEFFIYGEILAIDGHRLVIEQHMDSGSVDVGGEVTLSSDVEVRANRGDATVDARASDLEVGQVVGMNVGVDGRVYRVVFDDDAHTTPTKPKAPARDVFVYFDIVGLDRERGTISIEQHMDSHSVKVDETLTWSHDVEVFLSGHKEEIPTTLDALRIGQSGGLLLDQAGRVRHIVVDSFEEIRPAAPQHGEVFIYAEILGIEGQNVRIDQHMDAGSVDVGGRVTLAEDVIVRGLVDGYAIIPLEAGDVNVGEVVGMIQGTDGLIRAIVVE